MAATASAGEPEPEPDSTGGSSTCSGLDWELAGITKLILDLRYCYIRELDNN